jgi:hypothetical protein
METKESAACCLHGDTGRQPLRQKHADRAPNTRQEIHSDCFAPSNSCNTRELNELVLFSIYLILSAPLGPVVHSASNRNEYQKQKNNVSAE